MRKTVDWIWILFGMVSGVSRGMDVLDWDEDRRREGTVLGVNVGHPIVTEGHCGIVILCREGWRRSSSQITFGILVVIVTPTW